VLFPKLILKKIYINTIYRKYFLNFFSKLIFKNYHNILNKTQFVYLKLSLLFAPLSMLINTRNVLKLNLHNFGNKRLK